MLQCEQSGFQVHPSPVTGEHTVRAGRPVARDEKRDRIAADRHPDGTDRMRFSELCGDLSILPRFPVRDLHQNAPDGAHKRSPFRNKRQIEVGTKPVEILLKLLKRFRQKGGPPPAGSFFDDLIREIYADNRTTGLFYPDRAELGLLNPCMCCVVLSFIITSCLVRWTPRKLRMFNGLRRTGAAGSYLITRFSIFSVATIAAAS